MTQPTQCDKFAINTENLSKLVHVLIKNAYDNGYNIVSPDLVELASSILSNYNQMDIMEKFISKSYPHWDSIKAKDEDFFASHASSLFQGIPLSNVDSFKQLFTLNDSNGNPVIAQEERDAIWAYFDSFVRICIRHIYITRMPQRSWSGDIIYTKTYFPEIDLSTAAQIWGVKLDMI